MLRRLLISLVLATLALTATAIQPNQQELPPDAGGGGPEFQVCWTQDPSGTGSCLRVCTHTIAFFPPFFTLTWVTYTYVSC
jgi:hypothetical protein